MNRPARVKSESPEAHSIDVKPFKSEEGVKKDEEGVRGRRSLKREIKEEQEHKEGIKKEEVKQEELKLKAEEDEDSKPASKRIKKEEDVVMNDEAIALLLARHNIRTYWEGNVFSDFSSNQPAPLQFFHRTSLAHNPIVWKTLSDQKRRQILSLHSNSVAVRHVFNPLLPLESSCPIVILPCAPSFTVGHATLYSKPLSVIASPKGFPGFEAPSKSQHWQLLGHYTLLAVVRSRPGNFTSLPQERRCEIVRRTRIALEEPDKQNGAQTWSLRSVRGMSDVNAEERIAEDLEGLSGTEMKWEVWALSEDQTEAQREFEIARKRQAAPKKKK